MNNIKATILTAALMLSCVMPQISFAHSSSSFATQMMHNLLNAHHAFGGLLFVAVVIYLLKFRKKLVAKRLHHKD